VAAKSYGDRAAKVARMSERTRLDALKIMRRVLSVASKEPDRVEKDAMLPKMEAPFYLHAAMQFGVDSVRREIDKQEGPGTTLNVLIMGQAPTNEAWLQAVKDSQQPKLIEATIEEPKKS